MILQRNPNQRVQRHGDLVLHRLRHLGAARCLLIALHA